MLNKEVTGKIRTTKKLLIAFRKKTEILAYIMRKEYLDNCTLRRYIESKKQKKSCE